MAQVGMKYPVYAPIADYTPGQPIQYGQGIVLGEAIRAEVNLERADARLYGDNALQDRDNSITGGSETLNVTRLSLEKKATVLGLVHDEENDEYYVTDAASPYGGNGYLNEYREKGHTSYEGIWIYRAQFSADSMTSQTKAQTIEFNTPTINGEVFGVSLDNTGEIRFYTHKFFKTEAEGIAWLKTMANIPDETTED